MFSPAGRPSPALVLFDIDGTLLRRSGPHHREALVDAVRQVSGLEATTDGIAVQGMLDRDILTRMMRAAGASRTLIRQTLPAVVEEAQDLYVRRCPDLRRKTCPGARSALYRLARRHIPAGLVTGNLSRIGWRKVDRAGLKPYFALGAFSEEASTRARLGRLAVRKAIRLGLVRRDCAVTLVGDHPNDIRAARENGFRAVAVATGLSPAEELELHHPDILLHDLRALHWGHVLRTKLRTSDR